jgi:hypothetical protein
LPDEEESRRVLGFPISLFPGLQPGQELPQEAEHRSGDNLSHQWHPIAWVRWRIALRRRGPYTPDFEEFRRRPGPK